MEGAWICCEKCGKRLLKRRPNGIFVFEFGYSKTENGNESLVEMEIHGSLKMKCTRKSCKAMNTVNYFPGSP